MAFRKTNGMSRTFNANAGIFKKLADGRGGFHLKYPGAGKHVEVDISRQVMVLANHRKPQYTIPVSTGAPATPTIRGHFRFYSRQPGYNSSGMYYSVYFRGGYATHGYHSVPDLSGQPRLRSKPDLAVGLHLRLGPARDVDLRLRLESQYSTGEIRPWRPQPMSTLKRRAPRSSTSFASTLS